MADKARDKRIGEAVDRLKESIANEVEQHQDAEVSLEDLEDLSGGWKISYTTDPAPSTDSRDA